MSDTPLYTALRALADENPLRLCMPGHKGAFMPEASFLPLAEIDFTELPPTGNLYEGVGPISDAERLLAAAYGAPQAFFLTGGSTQGVLAALALACPPGSRFLCDRACHKSVQAAAVLLDLTPEFVYPEMTRFGFTGRIQPEALAAAFCRVPDAAAFILVSPTYYGVRQDIPALAAVCRAAGARLIVDSAHGAHFPALGISSAVEDGAALAVLSAHKTLPAMGQSAFLLADSSFSPDAVRRFTALFGTSSPSYALMASLDLARAHLTSQEGRAAWRGAMERVASLRERISRSTPLHALCPSDGLVLDPCRLTVHMPPGASGNALSQALISSYNLFCEMADERNVVFIFTSCDDSARGDALFEALSALSCGFSETDEEQAPLSVPHPERVCSPRTAFFSAGEAVALSHACGRVCARNITPYPPGIPVLCAGERVDEFCIEYLIKIGYNKCSKILVMS